MAFTPSYINYMTSPSLEEYFTDKATTLNLSNGYVWFFQDAARSIGNPVYQITGTPGAYSFITYGFYDTGGQWRVNLNSQGSFDEAIYYLPYDSSGNVQLYFIQVYNSAGVFQFSREAWPSGLVPGSGGGGGTIISQSNNFIINSQFITGNDYNGTGKIPTGGTGVYPVAQGGWTFERPPASTSTDFVTFNELFYGTVPAGNPDQQVTIQCTAAGTDAYKYFGIRWENVNKFQNQGAFTFSFTGVSNSSSAIVQLLLIRNCGSGGSTPAPILLDTYTISGSYANFTTTFTFPSNSGLVEGAGNFVELALSFPPTTSFNLSFTNFIFTQGTVASPILGPITGESQLAALPASLPPPDTQGMDLYLPLVLTPGGMTYDASSIGQVMATMGTTVPVSWLLMNGAQYDPNTWSSDGIPYQRLFNVLWNSSINMSAGGTGPTFTSALPLASDATTLIISTNNAASQTAATDGTVATGFTFNPANTPAVPGSATYNLLCPTWTSTGFIIYCLSTGVGFQQTVDVSTGFNFFYETDYKDATPRQLIYVSNVGTGASLKVGSGTAKHFNTANTTTKFYVWYQVDGVGNDPATAGMTGIKVNLLSAYTSADVVLATSRALSGHHQDFITFTSGSTVPTSSYFNLNTTQGAVYVWYKVNGAGTDPAAASIGVEVDILSTDGASAVAKATQAAINKRFFAVPNFQGVFLRGNDTNAIFDIDVAGRWSYNGITKGATPGTFELGQNQSHDHVLNGVYYTGATSGPPGSGGASRDFLPPAISATQGDQENIPVNASVNYMIKY
jgi:hypothetical protein